MKQALKKALTQNLGLKLLALVLSFFLWLVVVNVDDPTQTRTFTAVVTVTNENVITQAGKLYEIKDGINTVSFRVTAKRSIIEKLSSADFSAVADMRYLESEERVPVTITAKTYSSHITISSKQNYLYVLLEDELTSRFIIETATEGTPGNNLAINTVACSPTVLTVTGPEDVVVSIARVVATCDIDGVTADITESVMPKFYDAEGLEIDSSNLQLSVSTVDVAVDFVTLKSADIVVKTSGHLSEGLTLGSISTDPVSVMIKGQPAVLNDVTSITIPETVINLSDLTSSIVTTVDINSYLPEGVSLVDSATSNVNIYVNLGSDVSRTVEITSNNVRFANIPDGMTVALSEEPIVVTIFGSQSAIDSFSSEFLTGYVDCANLLEAGEHSAVLQFDELDDISVQNMAVMLTATGSPTVPEVVEEEEEAEPSDT